jgi:hypothetical protein
MSSNPPYKKCVAPGKASKVNEYQRTLKALAESRWLSRRQISAVTRLEIPTLCRTLYNLVRRKKVKVAFRARCPITGKLVYHYSLASEKGLRDGK